MILWKSFSSLLFNDESILSNFEVCVCNFLMAVSMRGFKAPFGFSTLFNLSDIPGFCGFDHLLDSEAIGLDLEIN
jgi:hypothetical protein